MFTRCRRGDHVSRRAFLKGLVGTAAGGVVMNWGALTNTAALAEEARKQKKHCILLWMNGGASQFETFDMKPGRPTGGAFPPLHPHLPGPPLFEVMAEMWQPKGKGAGIPP